MYWLAKRKLTLCLSDFYKPLSLLILRILAELSRVEVAIAVFPAGLLKVFLCRVWLIIHSVFTVTTSNVIRSSQAEWPQISEILVIDCDLSSLSNSLG